MKKIYSVKIIVAIIFFICAINNLKAQMVYLPDTNFRNKLVNLGYGSCIVGDSIDSSCPLVANAVSLDVSNFNIHNLQGIQAFENLQTFYCYNDSLSTVPSLPTSLTYLDCTGNLFTILPILPNSLTTLICGSNQLTNLPSLPSTLTTLSCNNNQLTNLPGLPNSLTSLDCNHNQITSLESLPNSLTSINCSYNQIPSLTALPNSLTLFNCIGNQMAYILSLPTSLTILHCEHNQLTQLPEIDLSSLSELYCTDNLMIDLPYLPNSLTILYCGDNQITNLPTLPNSLVTLLCNNNNLISLPSLPNSLINLTCPYNQLTNIPPLPNSLYGLSCAANQLTSLPNLPNSLGVLSCDYNQITSLPVLPNSLHEIWCIGNLLTTLPDLPDSLHRMVCYYNPISCLPQLKRIYDFRFYNTNITCLPNYGNVTLSNPPLSSVPLCGLFNPYGCNSFYNISGKNYFDSNINCAFDIGDLRQPNNHIMLYKNGNLIQQVFTGGEGYYSFDVLDSVGNYSIQLDTSNIPFIVLCPASINYNDTITAIDTVFYDNDFALKCKTGFDLGAWSIESNSFWVAHQTTVHIQAGDIANFYGTRCATGVGGSITIALDSSLSYLSPAPGALTPSIVSGNTLTYNIADFGTVNFNSDFNIIVATDTFAVIGSQACITVSALPIVGDYNPSNNTLTHCFTIVGSYDPNEKEVDPISEIDLTGNKWLTYTIHFQNTGTVPAEHIYIDDTLNANLDLSTFQLLAYSYQPLVQILEGGIARFNFPNINLPDSNTNESASHGYVQYKIKVKDNATVGTQINNTAYIYFDFNTPVVTNTTVNTVTNSVGIATINNDLQISVFPNPTHDEFIVQSSKFRVGQKINLRLSDVLGKELLVQSMRSANYQLSTNDYPSGIYFLRIETADGITVKKLVKE